MTGSVEHLLKEVAGQKLVLVLPATIVTLMKANVTAKSDKQLAAAVPFALEEELAEDVERLHFVIFENKRDVGVTAAIVDKQLIQQLHQQLAQGHYRSLFLVPETVLLPIHEDGWTMSIDDSLAVLRKGAVEGYGVDTANLEALLAAEVQSLDEAAKSTIHIHDFRDNPEQLISIDALEWKQEQVLSPIAKLSRLALFLQESLKQPLERYNMLTGEFVITQEIKGIRRNWSIAASLIVASLLIYILSGVLENSRLDKQRANLDAAMVSLYQDVFPGDAGFNRPLSSMQKRLAELKQQNGAVNYPLLSYLAVSGKHLKSMPTGSIESIRFNNQALEVDLKTTSIESIEAVQKKIKQEALRAELKAITNEGGTIRGRLLISQEQKS